MKQIGLFVHGGREDAPAYAARAVKALQNAGAEVWAEQNAASYLHVKELSQAEHLDALIALGGDGTLLRAAQEAVRTNAPLLGINLGHMGFLTETEPDCLETAVKALMEERDTLENRMLLRIDRPHTGESYLALTPGLGEGRRPDAYYLLSFQ